jgi:O-antigen ligase
MHIPSFPILFISLFAFLGPLGNLPWKSVLPYQFRTFYLVLPLFFFFYTKFSYRELKTLLLFSPFFLYALASSYFSLNEPELHFETSRLSRMLLFICETFFMFGAAFFCRNRIALEEKSRLLRLYLYGFFLSLIVGYCLWIGYYSHLLSFKTVDRFTMITQFGWSILRFSPGSYPNEYGIVSSFVASILLLLIFEKKNLPLPLKFGRPFLFFFLALTLFALLLTTTRAAYLSFLFSLLYIFAISPPFRKFSFYAIWPLGALLFFLKAQLIPFGKILIRAFFFKNTQDLSIQLRFDHWKESLQAFQDAPLLGRGFGSLFYVHNVYIEFFAELGLIGCLTLCFFALSYFTEHRHKIFSLFFKSRAFGKEFLVNRITVVGIFHVFWFAATNHNLNHHLTWMVFLLFNLSLFAKSGHNSFGQDAQTLYETAQLGTAQRDLGSLLE